MSETRKNHLNIDGGQVKEDDNVSSYKPIPESDTGFRTSKSSLSKSKEKVDEAEERLLKGEGGEKVVCVDMADAKYVVGDHRNGDAKIELDANKRQFSGLTKEELLKYADDPFWVRLRWFMFILFWALWLCMLAGAIAIIIRAPKCSPPPPKTWYEKGPLVDSTANSIAEVEEMLPFLSSNKVQGVFVNADPAYDVLDKPEVLERVKSFIEKAKNFGLKVIVDLTPNYVSNASSWFQQSVNRSAEYDGYFIWAKPTEYDGDKPKPPNNWVSTENEPAWTYHPDRGEFYLHQYRADQPDLNFRNPAVIAHFDEVLKSYINAGVDGVRLVNARQLLVNTSLPREEPESIHKSLGADHLSYNFLRHRYTRDQPELDALLSHWASIVNPDSTAERVFTMRETSPPELFLLQHNVSSLSPRSAANIQILRNSAETSARRINQYLNSTWNALQLTTQPGHEVELAEFALLLPAAPVLDVKHLDDDTNTSTTSLSHLVALREDASIQHGRRWVGALNTTSGVHLLAAARWKPGHTGYLAVLNPSDEDAMANLTLPSVPAALTVHHATKAAAAANYTNHMSVDRDSVLVPAHATLVLSYVPEKDD